MVVATACYLEWVDAHCRSEGGEHMPSLVETSSAVGCSEVASCDSGQMDPPTIPVELVWSLDAMEAEAFFAQDLACSYHLVAWILMQC